MTRTELLEETRLVVGDILLPYAWSDTRLMAWLSEGQDVFCEKTGFWQDQTNYGITTVLDQTAYPIPDRIISVKSVWDGTRQLIDGAGLTFDTTDFADLTAQTPQHYQVNRDTGSLTLFEPPLAGIDLTIRAHRRSRSPLTRKTSVATLGGTFHAGDVVTVLINGTTFSYTALAGDATLSGVATALAALISVSSAFVATVSGQAVGIASSDLAVSTTTTAQVTGAGATTTVTAVDSYTAEPELAERFHNALVEYAAHKAYRDHDRELQDPLKANDHYALFMQYVREGRSAHRALTGDYPDVEPNGLYVV